MSPELRQLLNRSKFHRGAVNAVAALLPADDGELDGLIGETVRERDQFGFVSITMAALQTGRKVDARHLADGAMMIPTVNLLGGIVLHLQGELAGPLLLAVEHSKLRPEVEAAALFLIGVWCQEQGGRALPPGVIPHARTFARSPRLKSEAHCLLLALALLQGDANLHAVLAERYTNPDTAKQKAVEDAARAMGEAYLKVWRGPVERLIPAAPPEVLARGFTMRRAVARVGRNDPCPCGSGKKHKHCCIAKDDERLHFSTDVAGKTEAELQAEPEPYLTKPKLLKADPHEAVRWDPRKLRPELRGDYFVKLSAFKLFDRAAEAFELLGWSGELDESWRFVAYFVARAGRKDVAERMMRVRPDAGAIERELFIPLRLLLAEGDPARQIQILEECAMKTLQSTDEEALSDFGHGLLLSRFRGLGIFVTRSLVPLLSQKKTSFLFERLLEARDHLNLPPDDPFGDILDERFRAHDAGEGKEADALREVQHRLDAKAKEVRLLKESLERAYQEVKKHEPAPATAAPVVAAAAPASAPAEERALQELRHKMEGLKAALKQRHNERNELRRELHKAHADMEALRQQSAPHEHGDSHPQDAADSEDELLLSPEPATHQPVRIIEFPKRFQEGLASLPRAVARGALTMLGRLAAGEPAAFVGVVRLKACPGVLRQRIGSDFRLLFRLLPDRVSVVDLVPRQDLVRRIKTLV